MDENAPILRKSPCNCGYPSLRVLGVLIVLLPIFVLGGAGLIVYIRIALIHQGQEVWCTPSGVYYDERGNLVSPSEGDSFGIVLFDCGGPETGIYLYSPPLPLPSPGIQQKFQRSKWSDSFLGFDVYYPEGKVEYHPWYNRFLFACIVGISGFSVVVVTTRVFLYCKMSRRREHPIEMCCGIFFPCCL